MCSGMNFAIGANAALVRKRSMACRNLSLIEVGACGALLYKFAAATTLHHIKPEGFKYVLAHADAKNEPLVRIIKHLQSNIE